MHAQSVNFPVANLNNVRYASAFPGATAGVKIANCIADLPASGGVCDARGLEGAQTIAADPFAGMALPAAPTLGSTAGGSLPQTQYFVEITYVGGPKGETGPSIETVETVPANQLLTVSCPNAPAASGATGCNVYAASVWGSESKQNASTVALSGTWTEPASGLVSGAARPTGKQGTLRLGAGQYNTSATINPPSGWNIECVYGGKAFGIPVDPEAGTTLFWTGAGNLPVIKIFNAHHVSIRGCTIDGNLTAGSTGILMDSTNAPPGHNIVIQDFNLYRLAVGVQVGTASLPDSAGYEVDKWQLFNGSIDSNMAGSEGIVINGANKAQDSKIQAVTLADVDTDIDLTGGGSYLDIEDCSFGSPVSSGHTDAIKTIGAVTIIIKGGSSERTTNGSHFIHNFVSGYNTGSVVMTMMQTTVNDPIIIQGTSNFLSVGNAAFTQSTVGISSISVSSGTVTVNTSAAHNLTTSDYVIIAGVTGTGFNGSFPVASTSSGTQFTYSDAAASGAASGGTAMKSLAVLDGTGAISGYPKLTSIGDYLNNEAGWSVIGNATYEKLQEADTIIPNSLEVGTRIVPGLNSVAFSTTPAFDLSKGNIQQFSCTTAGSTISPTFTNLTRGELMTLIFVQNSTTACTVSWPSNVHGAMIVSATLSGVNTQQFMVSNAGTDLYAVGPTGMTGGKP